MSCEVLIDDSDKFYCPFADCSALLINDETEAVIKAECPNFNRMFCALCKVPWHEGIECSEFEMLNADEREKEDVMLVGLAKDKKWMRCPNCRIYVAKSHDWWKLWNTAVPSKFLIFCWRLLHDRLATRIQTHNQVSYKSVK